jgi:catechol 2,3-dioxygenase
MERVVTAIGHVGLRVPDLGACVEHAEGVLGLRVVERTGDEAFLTCGGPHHALHLIGDESGFVDHIGLVAAGPEELERLARRLAGEGISAKPRPVAHVERSLVFQGPEGFTFEVYTGMTNVPPDYPTAGIRPRRLGHVNLRASRPDWMAAFLQRVLGFVVSDVIGDGAAYFLRCNHDHHGVAVTSGPATLHHYAWEVRDVSELVNLCDLLDVRGAGVLWGPVRHGAGENIAVYHREPSGAVVEHYTDMERIYDDGRSRSGRWTADDPRWLSRWAPAMLSGALRDLGLPPRLAPDEAASLGDQP